ncbi:Afadin and alpha-actinin-binding-domain-containing protein [Aspergillus lucknowensis]|uniref:Afadin and alpha-actinin-binding-domain-containing protein n=1 Tax=Aspergillus lucknowensis TaxID=176173 RepID=A0ABR4LK62_9EURO
MEPKGDLHAASTYINNVLLARGLVKSGRPINFANPESEEGGVTTTMARIINLVNDLVSRRDREAEHRENLATTIRTLRAEDSYKTVEITSELSRSLALAEAQERALKSNISGAEATIRGLKDQVQRMKTTVQQVRSQCANDIRKRDLELQKLKAHLADRQRGKREGLGVTTININPAASQSSRTRYFSGGEGVHDPGYSLKQETNEFLTQLCQTLSDENDSLILLARNTVHTLKELQGLSSGEDTGAGKGYSHGTGSMLTQRPTHGVPAVASLPASCEELSGEMDQVLLHLRTLLTNPSFVPLEEVEARDEEIGRLREGWEKMESRWRQAVTMMDGWHKRIAHGGDSVRAEELRMGLKLDVQIESRSSRVRDGDRDVAMHSPIFEDQEEEENEYDEVDEMEELTSSQEAVEPPPEQHPQPSPSRALKERSDNVVSAGRPSRKEVALSEKSCESPRNPRPEDDDTMPIKAHQSDAVTRRPSRKRVEPKGPRPAPSRMSVHQKLAAAESEARAAEQARREQESRKRSRGVKALIPSLSPSCVFQQLKMPDTYAGWVAHDPKNPLIYESFTPKPFEETDIEVQISHCGICGSDVHTIRSGWAPADYPCVVGHEIVGTAIRVGSKVRPSPDGHLIKVGDRVGSKVRPSPDGHLIKVGDRVGIGAQCSSCLRPDCEACSDNEESYCPKIVGTYNSRFPDGSKAYGGYANRWRGPGHFVFAIPGDLGSAEAAPLLCGGVTVFAPLRRFGAGPGKKVGIVGIGGLGHMGILFARALGSDSVVAISRSSAKKADATGPGGLGADSFIATGEDKNWARKYSRSLDLIICTVSGENMPLSGYLRLLKRNGVFVQVGAPEEPLPALRAFSLIQKGVKVTGSNIGSPEDIRAMLKLAAEKGVKPWVQTRPMQEVNLALEEMHEGKARYRYVLENSGKVGKL